MDKTSYKIAVVGNRDTILPFKLIGFQTFPVKEAQETVNTLRRLAREDFSIIYLDGGYGCGYSRNPWPTMTSWRFLLLCYSYP